MFFYFVPYEDDYNQHDWSQAFSRIERIIRRYSNYLKSNHDLYTIRDRMRQGQPLLAKHFIQTGDEIYRPFLSHRDGVISFIGEKAEGTATTFHFDITCRWGYCSTEGSAVYEHVVRLILITLWRSRLIFFSLQGYKDAWTPAIREYNQMFSVTSDNEDDVTYGGLLVDNQYIAWGEECDGEDE